MSDSKTPEETSKKEIAKQVVTPKRRYFFPSKGKSVEAESYDEALKALEAETNKKEKDGDA